MKNKIISNPILNSIRDVLNKHQVFLVGGFLRDLFLGKNSSDFDLIVCDIPPKDFAKKIANKLNGVLVELDCENEIYRVVVDNYYFDITKPINNSVEEDIKRRDFRINSLFFDLEKNEFYDPYNVRKDLEYGVIKTHNLKNFDDDPLRILRTFRFKSLLGFKIDKDILDYIKENGKKINLVASERINYEILRMFEGENLIDTLNLMKETGFLAILFPPLADVMKIPPNSHHHLPLIDHSIETVKNIRINKPILKLSALLHDIGKPQTWKIDVETGRHRFIGHDEVGSIMAKKLLSDLKFSTKQTDYIVKMIKYHIYPSSLAREEEAGEKAYLRFIRKIHPDVLDLIELARADRLSARGPAVTDVMVKENLENLDKIKSFYKRVLPTMVEMPKLLDGYEIMEILGLERGKKLGAIIDALKEAQILGKVKTKAQAISFIKEVTSKIN